jgi:hypothetical protein
MKLMLERQGPFAPRRDYLRSIGGCPEAFTRRNPSGSFPSDAYDKPVLSLERREVIQSHGIALKVDGTDAIDNDLRCVSIVRHIRKSEHWGLCFLPLVFVTRARQIVAGLSKLSLFKTKIIIFPSYALPP